MKIEIINQKRKLNRDKSNRKRSYKITYKIHIYENFLTYYFRTVKIDPAAFKEEHLS